MRVSRTNVIYSASAATKDSTCVTDFGSGYGAATSLEITSYSKMYAPYDLGAAFAFNVRDDTAFSQYQYSPYITVTAGVTSAVMCVRIN